MKICRMLLVFALVFAFLSTNVTPSEAQTFSQYVSGVTIQNLLPTQTTVVATYYKQDGSIGGTTTDTIDGYGVKDYATVPVDTGFKGSLVLSSGNQIGAVSTLRGDNKGRGAYTGATMGAQSVTLPILMKNWGSSNWDTWFAVQNVSSEEATVEVDYAACPDSVDDSATIPPNSMVTFDQDDEACLTDPDNKLMTSATVTSDQDIAVVVVQESSVVNSSLVSSGFAGDGSTEPVIPLVNANNPTKTGWRTAISIFNQGDLSTDVTLTYIRTDGSTCEESHTINSKQSVGFAGNNLIIGTPDPADLTCPIGEKLVGVAYVSENSASQPLVATVNQDRGGLSSAYGSLSPDIGTPKVFFPQIQDRNGALNQWASSFMVMNVGGDTTFVKCTFANSSYSPESSALDSYSAWENLQRGNIAAGYVGSGECTAYTDATYTTIDTAAKIVAVVNVRGTGNNYDLMMSYEGMNVAP